MFFCFFRGTVRAYVLLSIYKLQVVDCIISPVLVDVMHVVASWDGAVMGFPHIYMKPPWRNKSFVPRVVPPVPVILMLTHCYPVHWMR